MNKRTVLELARVAGLAESVDDYNPYWTADDTDTLERFAKLIAEHEREECAKVCENLEMRNDCYDGTGNYVAGWSDGTDDCAAAIRSRT